MFSIIKENRVLSLVLAVIFCMILSQGVLQAAYSAGEIASDFTCVDLNGKSVSLSDYSGYAILINFFAWW